MSLYLKFFGIDYFDSNMIIYQILIKHLLPTLESSDIITIIIPYELVFKPQITPIWGVEDILFCDGYFKVVLLCEDRYYGSDMPGMYTYGLLEAHILNKFSSRVYDIDLIYKKHT
jgi:hypothetical protein